MRRFVSDAELRARLRREGLAHAGQFSWRSTAAGMLDVIVEAAREGRAP